MSSRASIGEYVVTSKLGSGSFAVVYKGYHKVTKVPVAIKALSLAKLNAKLLANLEMEIAIMRQIDHPNVVKLYEIKKTEKHMYLMLEYCAGGDLQQYMKRQQQKGSTALTEEVARHFLKELAKGMKCLWTHNLIHRDLKPQNLLLTEDSAQASLKIADFGFARHLATASMAETLCGSPLYMAPEILKFQKYDAKADLWSVGTILYELVVGKPPYGGSNHVQLLANIERNDLRFPKDIVLSDGCRSLLTGLLHRRPANRTGFDEFFRDAFVGLGGEADATSRFQTIRTTTSIREEDDEEEEKEGKQSEDAPAYRHSVSGGSTHDEQRSSRSKERSASESQMDTEASTSNAVYSSSLRSSRSGNMEVMQNAFGNTSGGNNGPFVSSAMRRSRLGRSRRATSSGAIFGNQHSPKLSPQMSPNVLPSPGPRINPFKELTDSPPLPPVPAGPGSDLRASRTHAAIVKHKNGAINHALDSSGEYVLVDSGSEKASSNVAALSPSPSPPPTQQTRASPTKSATTTSNNSLTSIPATRSTSTNVDMTVEFSHEYAQKLVEIVNLRIQAIAPIAEQLWKMSSSPSGTSSQHSISGSASGPNFASVFSLSSSTSSASGQALAGVTSSSSAFGESNTSLGKKQYVYAAEALALYVKCMRMLQHTLLYLRQDPALARTRRLSAGSNSPQDRKAPAPWTEASRKVSMAFLAEQLNIFLDRAEQCKGRMSSFTAGSQVSNELQSLVVSQDDLLYTHAIRLGKEGAVKEVLGQSRASYELYLQAMLLLESVLMESPLGAKSASSAAQNSLTIDDQKRIASFVKALDERLRCVKQSMVQQDPSRQSPPLLPRPMMTPHSAVGAGVAI